MSEEHRPLRAALARGDQPGEDFGDVSVAGGEPGVNGLAEISGGQSLESEGLDLAVEGAGAVVERRSQHPRLAAGEQIGGDLSVVLGVRADQRFGPGDLGDTLELIEHDQGASARARLAS